MVVGHWSTVYLQPLWILSFHYVSLQDDIFFPIHFLLSTVYFLLPPTTNHCLLTTTLVSSLPRYLIPQSTEGATSKRSDLKGHSPTSHLINTHQTFPEGLSWILPSLSRTSKSGGASRHCKVCGHNLTQHDPLHFPPTSQSPCCLYHS